MQKLHENPNSVVRKLMDQMKNDNKRVIREIHFDKLHNMI